MPNFVVVSKNYRCRDFYLQFSFQALIFPFSLFLTLIPRLLLHIYFLFQTPPTPNLHLPTAFTHFRLYPFLIRSTSVPPYAALRNLTRDSPSTKFCEKNLSTTSPSLVLPSLLRYPAFSIPLLSPLLPTTFSSLRFHPFLHPTLSEEPLAHLRTPSMPKSSAASFSNSSPFANFH